MLIPSYLVQSFFILLPYQSLMKEEKVRLWLDELSSSFIFRSPLRVSPFGDLKKSGKLSNKIQNTKQQLT